ncbi:MAG: class I SAM-dependent methyltransferase [Proteobacteria bacterium]|nr:class I SAM-dependent methyltransferase [Pseudomonadota bacterium]
MTKSVNESTVSSYSERGSEAYEDPMNKNFLYGDITVKFIRQIEFAATDHTILDMGCGTGFVFDELQSLFKDQGMEGVGVEPAVGMLDLARKKYAGDPMYSFHEGSFETIPLADQSVDKITSTLALHWVLDLEAAAVEMHRVLKPGGSVDILMIARDDGHNFKKQIVAAQKKHLTFAQIMRTATLVQRVNEPQVIEAFAAFHDGFKIDVSQHRSVIFGTFDEHLKWWKARSAPVIAEVVDKEQFIEDLRVELEKINTDEGIPFDSAYLNISIKGK